MQENKIKILCVEDEAEIRENICEILEDEGFVVFSADNAQNGYQQLIDHSPDIIISDILMPKIDGYKFLEMIRSNPKHHNVPFIFLSALGQKSDMIKGINLSANDYLIKPVDFDLMIAKIKEKITTKNKIDELHKNRLTNIKNQISAIVPQELFFHIDKIIKISQSLKEEPYGPMPHRHYLVDFNQIYLDATILKAIINNALDQQTIDNNLQEDESIIDIIGFLENCLKDLPQDLKGRIHLNKVLSFSLPKVKINPLVLANSIKQIISNIFGDNIDSDLEINMLLDHKNQLMIVFSFVNQQQNNTNNINSSEIISILQAHGCAFEIMKSNGNNAILSIPEYRLL